MIRDFKKVLAERKTPRNLILLNRMVMIIVGVTIALSSIEFWLKSKYVSNYYAMSEHSLMSEVRTL